MTESGQQYITSVEMVESMQNILISAKELRKLVEKYRMKVLVK